MDITDGHRISRRSKRTKRPLRITFRPSPRIKDSNNTMIIHTTNHTTSSLPENKLHRRFLIHRPRIPTTRFDIPTTSEDKSVIRSKVREPDDDNNTAGITGKINTFEE